MREFQFNGPNGAIATVCIDDSVPGVAQVEACYGTKDIEFLMAISKDIGWSLSDDAAEYRADNPGVALDRLLTSLLWKMNAKTWFEYAMFMQGRRRSG